MKPTRALCLTLIAVGFSLLAMPAAAQTKDTVRDSIRLLSMQIEQQPRNVKLRLQKAALNVEAEQWQYALDEYSNVLDIDPKNITALYYRGFVNQKMGRYSFARADYEKVLAVKPNDMHTMMGLTLTNLADGHNTLAFDQANILVEAYPDSVAAYAVRAEVESALGMTDAALEDILTAIKKEDKNPQSQLRMDDDIVTYYLQAFDYYFAMGNKYDARACLDLLVKRGIPKPYLNNRYKMFVKYPKPGEIDLGKKKK